MSEREQNAKINKLQRQLVNAVKRIKALELDVEPEGRISEGFTILEKHMDERFNHLEERINRMERQYNSRFDRMEHQFNQLQGKLEVILDAITGISDLPEDETEEI